MSETEPMTTRPFRHLCPDANRRDGLDDGDFWEYVFHGNRDPDWDGLGSYEPDIEVDIPHPCEVCGGSGPCAYDVDGHPMIRVVKEDDDT